MTSLFLAIEFIERNLHEDIRSNEIAAAASVSSSHLYKLFSRTFNQSPREYLVKRRMSWAADALVHGSRSITEIAFLTCYSTVEGFSRAFKRYYLLLPSEYRKTKPVIIDLYPKLSTAGEAHETEQPIC